MEDFHPLCWMLSDADAPSSVHCFTKLAQDCTELSAQEVMPNLLGLPLKVSLTFFLATWKFW